MLNSEKMVASIGNQDLDHADKYFKKALREDPAEVLVELGQYLSLLVSYHRHRKFTKKFVLIFQKLMSI